MAGAAPEEVPDLTAAPEAAQAELPPEVVALSLGEYVRAYASRIRAGVAGPPRTLPYTFSRVTSAGPLRWNPCQPIQSHTRRDNAQRVRSAVLRTATPIRSTISSVKSRPAISMPRK